MALANRRPVVIDCDPGNDDALAILMAAAAPELDIYGITTVAGNVSATQTAANGLALADWLGIDAPVTAGARPLLRAYEPLDPTIMGAGGMGATHLPAPARELDPRTSVELLWDCVRAHAGSLEVLATGPLTNLALLLVEHPEARDMIRQIVLMGGSVNGGNATPAAEFNIYVDAEAARIVFRSGIPLTMVGLDVCYENRLVAADFDHLAAVGGDTGQFVSDLFFYPEGGPRPFPAKGTPVFDSLAAAALIDPSCVRCERLFVDVETTGELTYGQTVVDVRGRLGREPNVEVAMAFDHERYLELVEQSVLAVDLFAGGASRH